jgi:hypothetical protein
MRKLVLSRTAPQKPLVAVFASVGVYVEKSVKKEFFHSSAFRPVKFLAPTAGAYRVVGVEKRRLHNSTFEGWGQIH